jgi:hypothetical protein
MEANKTKTASRSEFTRTTNPKPVASRVLAGTTAQRAVIPAVGSGKRTKTAAKRPPARKTAELNAQERAERIAQAAYFLAEQRAFAPNHELDDWLAAERSL